MSRGMNGASIIISLKNYFLKKYARFSKAQVVLEGLQWKRSIFIDLSKVAHRQSLGTLSERKVKRQRYDTWNIFVWFPPSDQLWALWSHDVSRSQPHPRGKWSCETWTHEVAIAQSNLTFTWHPRVWLEAPLDHNVSKPSGSTAIHLRRKYLIIPKNAQLS